MKSQSNEKVSFVMAVYQEKDEFLKRAITSVLNQTYSNIELIVVDDGMTLGHLNYINILNRENIVILPFVGRKGLTHSLNRGILAATGNFIARLDSDDWSEPNRIAKQMDLMQFEDTALSVSAYRNYDESGKSLGNYGFVLEKDIVDAICLGNPFGHSTYLFRKFIAGKITLYNESFRYAQDYELLVRLSTLGKIRPSSEVLVNRHVGTQTITSKHRQSQALFALKTRRKAIGLYGWNVKRGYRYIRTFCIALLPNPAFFCLKKIQQALTHLSFFKRR